jgi:hypothetical protein
VLSTQYSVLPTRREWRWLAAVGAVLLALLAVPYVVWLVWGPRDLVHIGSFWYPGDFPVYLAAMDQGARSGSWLIHDRFTPEPHQPIFMFPVYVGIGKLAALLHVAPMLVYYVGEIVSRIGLLMALYLYAAAFLPTIGQRRLALGLMIVGTNLGLWGALLLQPLYAAQSESAALALGAELEVMTLGVFLAPLHLMLGLACTLLAIVAYAAAAEPGATWRPYAGLAAAVLGLALVHPFNLPVVLGLFGLDTALRWLRGRRWPWRPVLATALAGGMALPLLLYNYWAFRIEPFWSVVYGNQNTVPSPALPRLLMDYGFVLLFAPLALRAWPRPRGDRQWLAVLTGALLLLALYAPVPFQRRLAFGVQPALAVLGAAGLAWWAARLSGRGRRRLGLAIVALSLPTAAFLYVGAVYSAVANTPLKVYVASREEWQAGEWLAARMTPDDVVLGVEKTGFWLAALVPGRVWLGHDGITYDVPGKRAVIDEVLHSTPGEAARILGDHGIRYLFYGPRERAEGAAITEAPGREEPLPAPPGIHGMRWLPALQRIYQQGDVEIYCVDKGGFPWPDLGRETNCTVPTNSASGAAGSRRPGD